MTGNKEAAPAAATAESGKGEKTFVRCITPVSNSTICGRQKQQERAQRLLFLLLNAAIQSGRDVYIPYAILSCISLIPEDEVRELCDFSALFGEVDG